MLFASRYLNDGRPVIAPSQSFTLTESESERDQDREGGSQGTRGRDDDHGRVIDKVVATDPDGDTLRNWQIKGGTAHIFSPSIPRLETSLSQVALGGIWETRTAIH